MVPAALRRGADCANRVPATLPIHVPSLGVMMKSTILIAALATIPYTSSAAEPATDATPGSKAAAVKGLAPADAARMRGALAAQIAVYDAAEGAMRDPTPAEIAAMGPPPTTGTSATFRLRGGGIGARTDASQISLLVVDRNADGTLVVRHVADARKEAAHAH